MNVRAVAAALALSMGLDGVAEAADAKAAGAVERGRDAVRGRPALNPPLWSIKAIDQVWQQWGLKEKPPEFARLFRECYGLHAAPYDNHGLAMGLHVTQGFLGKGVVSDCLLCHAGSVAGQTIIGLGNSSLELQALMDDLSAQDGVFRFPIRFSHVRGTIDAISPVAYLAEFRDADLNLRKTTKLDYAEHVCDDPPAWWLLKKKKTRNWTGAIDARAVRIDMVTILSPFNDADFVKKQEHVFADMHAFILSTRAPKYPFSVDEKLAGAGGKIFNKTCATCHGTYGPGGKYPNKIVPLEVIGTDPVLAKSFTQKNVDYFNKSWLAREKAADGTVLAVIWNEGYQPPPLDGVWATAPYFHNGSVPTLYHVLNSKARPAIYTRSFLSSRDDYDSVKVGLKITVLAGPPPGLSERERRAIYDTRLPGRGNAGHTFGDDLTDDERLAVIEYLKTL
jgi:hypothetical protein